MDRLFSLDRRYNKNSILNTKGSFKCNLSPNASKLSFKTLSKNQSTKKLNNYIVKKVDVN